MQPGRWTMSMMERWYVLARAFGYLLTSAVVVLALMNRFGDHDIYVMLAFGVFTASNVGFVLMRVRDRTSFEETLLWIIAFDLAWLGLLSYGLHDFEDPLVPALLAMPIFYAFLLRNRRSAYVALSAGVVYLISHLALIGIHDALALSFVALKAGTILFVGGVATVWASSYVERERLLEEGRHEKEALTVELQRRLTELQAVSQITEIIHSSLDFDRVGQLVLDILLKVLGIPACALFVIDKQKAQTLFSASVGIQATSLPQAPRGLDAIEDLYVADDHFSCQSVLDHPMMMVVFCAPAEAFDPLGDEDRLVLQAVASELVVAVENSQLYKLTRRLAITDELTGLNNYRFLQQRLDEEIERARRYGKDLSFLMLDVDDFKQYNDAYGHLAGDAALAELASVLRSAVREVDVVARYGGEEFSVILPETDAAGAFVVAEKVREGISRHTFGEEMSETPPQVTVSVGLATYPTHAFDKESLLREADDALYRAKTSGKNRVRSPITGHRPANDQAATVSEAD